MASLDLTLQSWLDRAAVFDLGLLPSLRCGLGGARSTSQDSAYPADSSHRSTSPASLGWPRDRGRPSP